MMILVALSLPALVGILLLAVLLRDDRDCGLLTRFCLAYPLGAGIVTLQMFVLGLLRVPLTLGYLVPPLLVEAVVLVLWLRIRRIPLSPRTHWPLWEAITSPDMSTLKKSAVVLLTIWAGVKLASVAAETGLLPIYAWDSWTNWSAGAKLFSSSRSLLLDAAPGDVFSAGVVLRIPSYPPHNPLMQTWMSLWLGGFDEVGVKFWSLLYLVSSVLFICALASAELGLLTGLAVTMIFLGSPLLSYHGVEVYSDLPLGTYILFALVAFLQVMKGKREYMTLVGLFSAESMFTKDEGLFFTAPLLISVFFYARRMRADTAGTRRMNVSLLAPLLLTLPWYAFKLIQGFGLGADGAHREFVFHPEVVIVAARSLLTLENFNVILIFLPLLFVAAGRPDRIFWHLLAPVASYALFFLMVYGSSRFYYDHFMNSTIFYRNILTYYPSLVFLALLLIRKIHSDMEADVGQSPGTLQKRSES